VHSYGYEMGNVLPRWLIAVLLLSGAACGTPDTSSPPPGPVVETRRVQGVALASIGNGELVLPNALTSVKFAVIGDSGRGSVQQHEVAAQMEWFREKFKYDFVLMLGDNIYEGPATEEDYRTKFEVPYRRLLADKVRFFAVLGNHDDPRQVSYAPFHMKGERYYSFVPPEDVLTRVATPVEFFALDSTNMDSAQLTWLDKGLAGSKASWKVVFMHHPLYTSGRYRTSSRVHRWLLEPVLVAHQVDAVFSGHEHIYQRTELQQGIQYFISGGAGSLRRGDGEAAPYIARTYDSDYHFMLVEIEAEAMHIQAVSRNGDTIDAATLTRRVARPAATASDTAGRR
jgi:3',5'-cyclic AMP phosphodiesterase CpdA